MVSSHNEFERYFSGVELYGDDFTPEEISDWFAVEKEAYAQLSSECGEYRYEYHALNWYHAFRHLGPREYDHVCGFGSAYGHEVDPLAGRIKRLTIVDSSEAFFGGAVAGVVPEYVKAEGSGDLPVMSGSFDLITCFGVLHHIPNVSFVVSELARTLVSGGFLVIREPITTMGDWRRARPGLTPRERGIPSSLFLDIVRKTGLIVEKRSFSLFAPLVAICNRLGARCYSYKSTVVIDAVLSRMFGWNYIYHPTSTLKKFAPASEFLVCRKP